MSSGKSDTLPAAEVEEFICARCGARGLTCCQHTQVFVTRGDLRRIGAATGKQDFHECAIAPAANRGDGEDPVWDRIFSPDGNRRVLRHKQEENRNDCCFLGEKGCALALADRPLICRLYPFEYDAVAIKGVSAHHCPEPERHSNPLMLALLGMNRDEAEEWRKMLYAEIIEEFPG